MRGWPSSLHQAAIKAMDELERLDPDNFTLSLSRSVFREAEAAGIKPSGRPPGGKAENNRARRAEREAADREAADLYASGLSTLEVAKRLGRSSGYVTDALRRTGTPRRRPGAPTGYRTDMARVERIRAARDEGKSLDAIGAAERISRERVRQICVAHGIEHAIHTELDADQLAAVHEYLCGASLEVVAAKYRIGTHAMRNWILRAGHVPRPIGTKAREFSPETRARAERAVTLYRRGLKTMEIADELGLAKPEMIYRYLAIGGVQPNRQPRALQ